MCSFAGYSILFVNWNLLGVDPRSNVDAMFLNKLSNFSLKSILRADNFLYLQVKSQLQDRLQELQPLPEMLKNTELKLHEREDDLRNSERRNSENAKLIAELNLKVNFKRLFDKHFFLVHCPTKL